MKHSGFVIAALAITLAGSGANAQFLLKDAEIHTVSGEVLTEGRVLIGADGTIETVDSVVLAPPGYDVIECEGKVVTPGLIEVSTQLGLVEVGAVSDTRDSDPGHEDTVRAAFSAADAFNPNSIVIPVTRSGGVTSVVSSPTGGLVSGQSAFVDLGDPRFFGRVAQAGIAQSIALGRSGSSATGGSRGGAILKVRELYDDVAFFAQNRAAFDRNQSRTLNATRLDLIALEATLEGQIPVVIHADRASDILAAVSLSQDLGLKPIISGGTQAWMVAEELAEARVPVIVNSMSNLPRYFERLGARADNAALLVEAGVPVILSSFSTHNARNLRFFAGNAVRAGLEHRDALRSITLTAAEAFGLDDRYGSIEAGKVANLVVWSGDPFEPSTRVEKLFVRGVDTSLDDRQQRLFEKYRTLDRRDEPGNPR